MSATNRRKGMVFERKIFNWLTDTGHNVTQTNRSGYDGDDLEVTANRTTFSVEVKNQRAMSLAAWVDQAASNAGTKLPVVVHHRQGKGDPAEDYVTMPLWVFRDILDRLHMQ